VTTFSASLTNITALYLSHKTAGAMSADEYWHPHSTLLHEHMTSRTFPTCAISLVLQKLPTPEAGDFMKLILL